VLRENLKAGIGELLHSKKFLVGVSSAIAVVLVRLAGKAGLGDVIDEQLANEIAMAILTIASVTIFGQGLADVGKEAAKVRQQTDLIQGPPSSSSTTVVVNQPEPPKESP
jgi:hypothetical protein